MDEVVGRELDAELLAEVLYSLGLVLAAAVREEDERDVILVQELEGFGSAGDGRRDVEEDAIDAAVCEIRNGLRQKVGIVIMTYSNAKAKGGASFCTLLVLYLRDSRSLLLLRLSVLPTDVENWALRTCFCVARGRLEAALRI